MTDLLHRVRPSINCLYAPLGLCVAFTLFLLVCTPQAVNAESASSLLHRSLVEAVKKGDPDEVRKLLMEGAPAEPAQDIAGFPIIMDAILAGQSRLIPLLLDWGADPKAVTELPVPGLPSDRKNISVMHVAAWRGDVTAISHLLQENAPANPLDSLGRTPLHYAAESGHLTVGSPGRKAVTLLLSKGGNLDAKDHLGMTPLSLAQPDLQLSKEPIPVPPKPPAIKPVLEPKIIPAPKKPAPLTKKPVLKPQKTKPVISPTVAIPLEAPKPSLPVKTLTSRVEWVSLKTTHARLRSAPTINGNTDTGQRVSAPGKLGVVRVVRGKDASKYLWVEVVTSKGKHVFIREDQLAALPDFDFDKVQRPVDTRLLHAARRQDINAVKALLAQGAMVLAAERAPETLAPYAGYTALHWAAEKGNLKLTKLLLESGAAPYQTNASGWTPADLASQQGFKQLAELINTPLTSPSP